MVKTNERLAALLQEFEARLMKESIVLKKLGSPGILIIVSKIFDVSEQSVSVSEDMVHPTF